MLPQFDRNIPDDRSIMIIAAGCAVFATITYIISLLCGRIAAAAFTFIALFWSIVRAVMFLANLAIRADNMELREQIIERWKHQLKKRGVMFKDPNGSATHLDQWKDQVEERDIEIEKLNKSIARLEKLIDDINFILMCPISQAVPTDPVFTSTKIMYSKKALQEHVEYSGKSVCPVTHETFPIDEVYQLRVIDQLCQKINEPQIAPKTD